MSKVKPGDRITWGAKGSSWIVDRITDGRIHFVDGSGKEMSNEKRCWSHYPGTIPEDFPSIEIVSTAPPNNDGWIEHGGGPCPVPPDTIVGVRFNSGGEWPKERAGDLIWHHVFDYCNIVAYRIVQSAASAQDGPARTVTCKEVVPGTYGVVEVWEQSDPSQKYVYAGVSPRDLTAQELRDAARIFEQLADALED